MYYRAVPPTRNHYFWFSLRNFLFLKYFHFFPLLISYFFPNFPVWVSYFHDLYYKCSVTHHTLGKGAFFVCVEDFPILLADHWWATAILSFIQSLLLVKSLYMSISFEIMVKLFHCMREKRMFSYTYIVFSSHQVS